MLLDSVDGGAGTVTIQPPNGGWPSGTAYQINFVQDSNHLDSILAQSQQFDISKMSADHEELIDYEEDLVTAPGVEGTTAPATAGAGDDKDNKNYVGLHSTSFRLV